MQVLKNGLSSAFAPAPAPVSIPEEASLPEPVRAAIPYKPVVVIVLCIAMFGMMVNGEGCKLGGLGGGGSSTGPIKVSRVQYKGRCFTSNSVVGTISNSSQKTAFGNLVLKMDWCDIDGNLMDTYSHPLFGRILRPNGSTPFRVPSRRPGAWKCDVSIKSASPIDASYY